MKIREFRAEAREALKGNWCVAVVAGIVFSLFTNFSVAIDINAENYTNAILAAGLSAEQILSVSGVALAVAIFFCRFAEALARITFLRIRYFYEIPPCL